ncbi:MAG: type II toxin-antitoxin system RatA family toxin [Acidiferrobacterales bacterium]
MHKYTENRLMGFTPEQVFNVVADVERYHEFLPGWLAARIVERNDNQLIVDQVVGLAAFRLEFISHATLERPDHIQIIARDGPFRLLDIDWHLEPASPSGCLARLKVEFELSSSLLERLLVMLFHITLRQILTAFEKRARRLYGSHSSAGRSSAV